MKLKTTIHLLFFVALGGITTSAIRNSSSPGSGFSNAPSEGNCTSCHAGSLITSGSNWNNIKLIGDFTGGGYIPDSSYTIQITHKQSGISKFGFQATVLHGNNVPSGEITVSGSRVQKHTQSFGSQTRQYAAHTSSGTNAVATDSANWSFTWKAPASNVGTVTFYVTINASNNNSNTSGDNIYAKTFTIQPSSLLPVASASKAPGTVCTSQEVQFFGSGTNNPTSYSWRFVGANITTSNLQNPKATFTSQGTRSAILTVSNNKGASQPDTLSFQVVNPPIATIVGNYAASICNGDSLLLTSGTTGVSYRWNPGGQTSRSIYVKNAGKYSVTVTNSTSGCSSTSPEFDLSILPTPTVSISNKAPDNFCEIFNDSILASSNGVDTFMWYNNGNLFATTITPAILLQTNQSTNIHAIGKSNAGCLSSPSNSIQLVKNTAIQASNLRIAQSGTDFISLQWDKNTGALGYEISLDSGQNFFASDTDTTHLVSSLVPNRFYLFQIRTLQNGICNGFVNSIQAQTLPCSDINFNIETDSAICLNSSLSTVVKGLSQNSFSISFNGQAFARDTIFEFSPTQNGNLNIRIIDSANLACPAIERNFAYTVDTPPADTISLDTNLAFCNGTPYLYRANPGFDSYSFFVNEIETSSSNLNSFTFSSLKNNDEVYAIGKKGACVVEQTKVKINILTTPEKGFSVERNHKTYLFSATEQNADSYQWYFGNIDSSTEKNPIIDFSLHQGKEIEVVLNVSNSNGCGNSDTSSLSILDVTNIEKIEKLKFEVGPVPFQDWFVIQHSEAQDFEYTLMDLQGKTVGKGHGINSVSVNTQHLVAGFYTLEVKKNGLNFYFKCIKQ
jgi:PKD repeat protein